MIVSLDYDDTWTADPAVWRAVAALLRARGHTVIAVTNRYDIPRFSEPVKRDMSRHVDAIIFAGPLPKRRAAAEYGYNVDIWIDDYPSAVDYGRR